MSRCEVVVDYVRGLSSLGYRVGRTERLVELRDHGVTLSFAGRVREREGGSLTIDELIRMRDRGDRY